MAERSSLNQTIQIGVETTPGTSVAASKKLQSISIEPNVKTEIDQFRPMGQKFRALTTLGKEWSEATVTGRGSYTEMVYAFSSVMDTATITTPGGGTTSRNWQFIPDPSNDDAPKTYTVEHGSSVRADKFTYGLFTEFGMTFNRTNIECSGAMLGRALTDGISLTGAPTLVSLVPIVPTQVSVYLETTSAANLGTTKLTRAISVECSIGSRFGPVWVLDAANNPFVNHIETEPDLTVSLMVQADAQGMALLSSLRTGQTCFLRVEAIGSIIEAAIPYEFTWDFALNVVDVGGFSDADGVYAIEFSFVGITDPTWGKATEVNIVNTLTAL